MRLKVVRNLTDNLKKKNVTGAFVEMLELRQRLFREHDPKLLLLDSYDLISDHVLLYSGIDNQLIGYVRSVTESQCLTYKVPYPMYLLLGGRAEYREGINEFRQRTGEAIHMGYLCFDPRYRDELRGAKFIDLMVWAALELSGVSHSEVGFTGTMNNVYKQDEAMKLLGEWIHQPDFNHPVIEALHRVLLIPRIDPNYWEHQFSKFKKLYGTLGDDEFDLLRVERQIAA
jgi:hypothetical protein